MTKCLGCGVLLQYDDINGLGYTNDISNDRCMRCFRLSNYGEYSKVKLDNSDFIKIINSIIIIFAK